MRCLSAVVSKVGEFGSESAQFKRLIVEHLLPLHRTNIRSSNEVPLSPRQCLLQVFNVLVSLLTVTVRVYFRRARMSAVVFDRRCGTSS